MLKNNLKREMTKRKISANKLSKEMNISVQTIKKIQSNSFHNLGGHMLTELLQYLNMDFYDLFEIRTKDEYIQEKLEEKEFNEQNLKILNKALSENTNFHFTLESYFNKSLNITIKSYSQKIHFSGNIRITSSFQNPTFEIIDFDFYKIQNNLDLHYFLDTYKSFVAALEIYAKELGFTVIAFNIHWYTNKNYQKYQNMKACSKNKEELFEMIFSKLIEDKTSYIELFKVAVLQSMFYHFPSKERQNLDQHNSTSIYYLDTTKMFKLINKELVPLSRTIQIY